MVTADKPNPPGQISVTPHNPNNYTYLVKWTPPVVSNGDMLLAGIAYQVQITYIAQEKALKSCSVFPVVEETSVIFDAKSAKGLVDCTMCQDPYKCGNDLFSDVTINIVAFYVGTPDVTSDNTSSCFSIREGQ